MSSTGNMYPVTLLICVQNIALGRFFENSYLILSTSKDLNVDIIAFTAHKSLYGPIGIGGFINVSGIDLDVVFAGGTGSDSLNLEYIYIIYGIKLTYPNSYCT